jgi:hypothetical protein
MRRRWSEQRIGVFFHLGRVLINREIGKQRLVTVRFAPKADITQRIEHVR